MEGETRYDNFCSVGREGETVQGREGGLEEVRKSIPWQEKRRGRDHKVGSSSGP
jgi:hypothetical protein